MNEKTGFWRRTYTIPSQMNSTKPIVRIITFLALVSAAPCAAQETDQPVLVIQSGSKATISSTAFSPDGRWLLISDGLGITKLFSVKTGKLLHRFAHPGRMIYSVFSPDRRLMATAALDGSVSSGIIRRE